MSSTLQRSSADLKKLRDTARQLPVESVRLRLLVPFKVAAVRDDQMHQIARDTLEQRTLDSEKNFQQVQRLVSILGQIKADSSKSKNVTTFHIAISESDLNQLNRGELPAVIVSASDRPPVSISAKPVVEVIASGREWLIRDEDHAYNTVLQNGHLVLTEKTIQRPYWFFHETKDDQGPQELAFEIPGEYKQQFLPSVKDYLFRGDAPANCRYGYVHPDFASDTWQKARFDDGAETTVRIVPDTNCIEMFVAPDLVGLLSISLTISADSETKLTGASAQEIVHRLASLYPSKKSRIATSPTTNSEKPTVESEREGAFQLSDVIRRVVSLVDEEFKFTWLQDRFSPVSVVELSGPTDASFLDEELRRASFLLADSLASGEPSSHPGNFEQKCGTDRVGVSACHLASISNAGAAHILTNQQHAYDAQRLRRAKDNYFVPYLLGFMQKLILNRISQDAATLENIERTHHSQNKRHRHHHHENIGRLRARMIRFALSGDFSQISTRSPIQDFYNRVRSLGMIPQTLDRIRQALGEHHDLDLTQEYVEIQKKIEIIEVFLITVYLLELYHVVTEVGGHFGNGLAMACFGFGLAVFAMIWKLLDPPIELGMRKRWGWGLAAILLTAALTIVTLNLKAIKTKFGMPTDKPASSEHHEDDH